ncbi:type II toxin-antitoxin system Phd/YefM family antitoxin [Vagococcus hydrophili]|uniref:Antitoxin n=1 Tax=Vagococcus hydrophili TaxID=2714947 RepID=A0A6G8AXA8_9ENTE|nr:type II toxin-antitoxin system Phd/YefM family antitoxin [Vagococcus hydrophili]QIL49585.1 type II toxin-antitoxin system Phd/YefM family antitoxin [Vagococcus hydrophili]
METIMYSDFLKNLWNYVKQVNESSDGIIVTNGNIEEEIVIISKNDYDAMQETLRVLSNSYVMKKIRRGDEQFSKVNLEVLDLTSDVSAKDHYQ